MDLLSRIKAGLRYRKAAVKWAVVALGLCATCSEQIFADTIHSKSRRFRIPFQFGINELHRTNAKEVRLYVSTNSRKWDLVEEVAPTESRFSFEAPADGLYLFSVKTASHSGLEFPPGPYESSLNVLVDTVDPELSLKLAPTDKNRLRVKWAASDDYLDLDTLTMEYQEPNSHEWIKIPNRGLHTGQFSWVAKQSGVYQVRGSISDLAGNSTSTFEQIRFEAPDLEKAVQHPAETGESNQTHLAHSKENVAQPVTSRSVASQSVTAQTGSTQPAMARSMTENVRSESARKENAGSRRVQEPRPSSSAEGKSVAPVMAAKGGRTPNTPDSSINPESGATNARSMVADTVETRNASTMPTRRIVRPTGTSSNLVVSQSGPVKSTAANGPPPLFDVPNNQAVVSHQPQTQRSDVIVTSDQTSQVASQVPTSQVAAYQQPVEQEWKMPVIRPAGSSIYLSHEPIEMPESSYFVAENRPRQGGNVAMQAINQAPLQAPGQGGIRPPTGTDLQVGVSDLQPVSLTADNQKTSSLVPSVLQAPDLELPAPVSRVTNQETDNSLKLQQIGTESLNLVHPPVTNYRDPIESSHNDSEKHQTNSLLFRIAYDLQEIGASGVSQIDLYITEDQGRNWFSYGPDPDRTSPIDVAVPYEGEFGFAFRVTNGLGRVDPPPQPGEAPEVYVVVDRTPPVATLQRVTYRGEPEKSEVEIRWQAQDRDLGSQPITLFYSESPTGPWQTVAADQPNTGFMNWTVPASVQQSFYLRMDVKDAAGNLTRVHADTPFVVDRIKPKARVTDIEPLTAPPR